MAELETPPRWLDEGSDLPRELLEGLRGCAEDAPSSAQRARMQESLLRGVASAAPVAGGALLKLGMVAVMLTCAAGALWWWREAHAPEQGSAEPRGREQAWPGVSAPEPPRAAAPVRQAAAPSVAAQDRTRALDGATTPAGAGQRAPSVSPRPKPGTAAAKPAPRRDAAGELALLTRARRALGSAPERSLELVAEHARVYGEGSFAQERELLAVEALVKMQRTEQARQRAARFAARYPGSAHLPRLEILLGPR